MNRLVRYTSLSQGAPALIALLLAGCVTPPSVQAPATGSKVAALKAREAMVARHPALTRSRAPEHWWALFNDATLIQLESEVGANLDLRTAALRIDESRAQSGLVDASRRPSLSARSGYASSAISENSPTHRLGAPTSSYNTWSLGMEAAWELDLWGHLRHLGESAQANLQAAYYGREAAEVSVTAEVARTYILLRGIQAQASLVEANQRIARDLVRMAESRERNGVANRFDAASARADAAALEARLTDLNHQRAALMNALALLLGRAPRELDARLTSAALPSMPARLPIGVPSDLARHRPDILQAEAKLHAAVADIGAAEADFYPRISLTGSLGVQGFNLSDLGSWDSRQFSLGPTLYLPIFEGGRLRRQLELSETRMSLAAVDYQQTVLRAWHEVDNALGAYASEGKRHEQLQSAIENNQVALSVAQRSYQEGSADFTTVLVARRTLLASQAELSDCATASALSVVSLYRALGGGWSANLQAEAATGRTRS
ncbi:efflux transporter outer membrane subunit [Brenneria tiliae]|uniref:efflux transporter outer membrane subunit n=1 Tax=Brenneria tiliae TaxID=2914984 RepID=UPI002014B552|nr:efflux transporter outer membrane subunit [Brenneria tiliae]MCL2897367.1 efflux transporter outer membrane subunit [Brenneria tiliae]MCL2901690.1 efflux transporter outer membrane subunit [Brenneria tiliae]